MAPFIHYTCASQQSCTGGNFPKESANNVTAHAGTNYCTGYFCFFLFFFCLLAHKICNAPHYFMPYGMVQRAKQRGVLRKIDSDMLCLYKQHADGEEIKTGSPLTFESPMTLSLKEKPTAQIMQTILEAEAILGEAGLLQSLRPQVFRNHADKQHKRS